MDADFLKKVTEDLSTSGFASEMRAIQVFLRNRWRCSGNTSYYDRDEGKVREIDISAYLWQRCDLVDNRHVISYFFVVAEVKKSDKPWVVFREKVTRPLDAWNNLAHCNWSDSLNPEIADAISEDSLLTMLGWRGYGIHESFKKPDQPSRWYSALVSVCKASEHVFERNTPSRNKEK
jgi:hypothetical protein